MPKRVDPQTQRRAIASAALQVINAVGLEGARLRDVAKAADVTTGAVMHYFDGKDAVLEAALEEAVRRILSKQERAREVGDALTVDSFIQGACSYLPLKPEGRQEWRVWLAFWGRAIADERLRARHRQYYSEIVRQLMALLPVLRPKSLPASEAQLERCADAVIAAIDGIGTRATLEPERWPPERQRETLFGLLFPLLDAFANGKDVA